MSPVRRPIEPPASPYQMPDSASGPAHGLLAAGGDLAPGTVLAAYRRGIFPWPDPEGRLLWWSPDPRTILPLDGFHESQRLRRRLRRGEFSVSVDQACRDVIAGCGDERAEGTWITPEIAAAYMGLHGLGWVHSIEVWNEAAAEATSGRQLVGGLYGVAVGGLFAAESMFHRATDASKVAVAALVEHLRARGFELLDVQFLTPHLRSLGCIEIARSDYLERLRRAIASPVLF